LIVLSIFAGCLLLNQAKVSSKASAMDLQDAEILKYYHAPTISDDFENDKINVILKSSYKTLRNVGFDDFKIVEQVAEISAISHNLEQINRGECKELALKEEENQILTLDLETKGKEVVLEAIKQLQKLDMVLVAEPSYVYNINSFWEPSDIYYEKQWNLNDYYGIHAKQAWEITKGNVNIKVGVMEDGVDMNHEDLQGRVFNGNLTSVDLKNKHGTHVAGIIGATQNTFGISGVAQVSMYLLDGNWNEFKNSLEYAEKNNIKIINASFGYEYEDGTYAPSEATHYTALKHYDGLIICAAGNETTNTDTTPMYPASYDLPNVMSVGAINSDGARRSTSNYGENTVDIFAPGGDIYSTVPCSYNSTGYDCMSGTSMAAPHVTGVAALILSYNPNLTAVEVKAAILDNVVKDSRLSSYCVTGGRLNAFDAVASIFSNPTSFTFVRYQINTMKPFTAGMADGHHEWGVESYLADGSRYGVEGYNFVGWSLKPGTFVDGVGTVGAEVAYSGHQKVKYLSTKRDVYLYAVWEARSWTVLEYQYSGLVGEREMHYDGPAETFTAKSIAGYQFVEWRKAYNNSSGYTTVSTDSTITLSPNETMPPHEHSSYLLIATYEEACVTEGTMITLADGSQVAVEDLTGEEQLLVWNLFTGTFDTAPILFIDRETLAEYEVIDLQFSDGSSVGVISEHGFYDITLNKYVYLDANAGQYIGHWFIGQEVDSNGNLISITVQLTDVSISTETTVAYSPVTYSHLCYYVNGMLSMPGGIDGLFNIFEVDEQTMKYDEKAMQKDIETYGLFTYEDFDGLISEEVFDAVQAQYLKVAIGKGLLTWEEIERLVARYADLLP